MDEVAVAEIAGASSAVASFAWVDSGKMALALLASVGRESVGYAVEIAVEVAAVVVFAFENRLVPSQTAAVAAVVAV